MTVKILLSGKRGKGKVALLSHEDADLAENKWHLGNHGYIRRFAGTRANKQCLLLHRVILERIVDRPLASDEEVDHVNRDRLDNRRGNLRLTTRRFNAFNRNMHDNNTSGFIGVSYDKRRDSWNAKVQYQEQVIHLGSYQSAEYAARVYDAAARNYFQDFVGQLNFPDENHDLAILTRARLLPSHNTSGYRGVCYDKNRHKWMASIRVNRRNIYLGRFDDPQEAAKAYDEAARQHFGRGAFLNFPD